MPEKILSHYVYFGPSSPAQARRILLARAYLCLFGVAFGFSAQEAAWAEVVTIVGDKEIMSEAQEMVLREVGCRTERLWGDDYALEILWRDRLERGSEFG